MAHDPPDPAGSQEEWLSEALGQLAGGMAHDLNNLLTATLAHVDLLEERIEAGEHERAADELREVRRTATTSSRMVKHLLSFSRGERLRPQALSLGDAVRDAMPLVRRLLPASVTVESELADPGDVLADPGAVRKMLVTLSANAAAAMPDGGRLELRVEGGGLDRDHLVRTGWGAPGDYGVVTVRDTGRGMPPETVAGLFRPFFEEKREGEDVGTGLTMSMVYGMMKQLRGFIEVESEPGTGTTVRLYFRLLAAAASVGRAEQEGAGDAASTVLVVEDDEDLLQVTSRILRAQGYRVIEAAHGLEALEVVQRDGAPDLLVTDLVMPTMTGIELLRRLEEEGPLPPVLLTSGFRPDFLLDWHRDPADFPFLEKPWTMDELVAEVRRLMPVPSRP